MTRRRARVVLVALIATSPAWSGTRRAHAQALQPPPPLPPSAPGPMPAPIYQAPGLPLTPVMPRSGATAEEAQDSGIGLEWVWLNADVGASYVNLQSLASSNLGLTKTAAGGPTFGVGGGVRLLFVTIGARVRGSLLPSLGDFWALDLEAKFHTRLGRLDPYVGLRGGYVFFGSLASETLGDAKSLGASVYGVDIGPAIGLDVYLTRLVSVGVDVDAQLLFLKRPASNIPLPVQAQLAPQTVSVFGASGSSTGLSVTPALHLGIHF